MSDYIKREDALEVVRKSSISYLGTRFAIEDAIEDIPAADVVERKQWIPVKERLPEAGKKVLVFAYGYDTITARMCKKTEDGYPVFECKGYDGIYREMARTGRISHWMPLPQPPESDNSLSCGIRKNFQQKSTVDNGACSANETSEKVKNG